MHIHEYQAKNLLRRYGVPISSYGIASNMADAHRVIKEFGFEEIVLKAQVHAGGRGKAGGVKFAKTADEALHLIQQMLGMRIVNNQTGPAGIVVNQILLTCPVQIKREFYVGATIDRKLGAPILMISSEGGMNIEEIAAQKPDKILKETIGLDGKLHGYQLLEMAKFLNWTGEIRQMGMDLLANVAKAFIENDASLLEINPLVETQEGRLIALDAKFTLDDNALFRQPSIAQWYDPSQLTKNEALAKQYDLAYVGLEGEIGCMVNGAGLAMATMDIIHYYGGRPANFLDVGGGASMEKVAQGFRIILLDPCVKAIFVNIFGGIMDCGVLAKGIVQASKEDRVIVPLIVRMEGTNVEIGKKILKESGLNIITADTMSDGALKAVQAAAK